MRPPRSGRRIVLVPTGTSRASAAQLSIRRYRVARLKLDTPEMTPSKPYEYLKRTFD